MSLAGRRRVSAVAQIDREEIDITRMTTKRRSQFWAPLFLVLTLALVAAACGDDDDAGTTTTAAATDTSEETTSERLYGVWITTGEFVYMSFNEDGSYEVAYEVARFGTDPLEFGTFTVDGDVLTFSGDPNSPHCWVSTGTYKATFPSETELDLRLIQDRCAERRSDLTSGPLVRKP